MLKIPNVDSSKTYFYLILFLKIITALRAVQIKQLVPTPPYYPNACWCLFFLKVFETATMWAAHSPSQSLSYLLGGTYAHYHQRLNFLSFLEDLG